MYEGNYPEKGDGIVKAGKPAFAAKNHHMVLVNYQAEAHEFCHSKTKNFFNKMCGDSVTWVAVKDGYTTCSIFDTLFSAISSNQTG